MLIYIAGPLGASSKNYGKIIENITRAVKVSDVIFSLGHECFIPHLMWFSHELIGWPVDEIKAMEYRLKLVKRSDALIRLPGESNGADKEVAEIAGQNKPLIYLQNISKLDIERCIRTLEKELNPEPTKDYTSDLAHYIFTGEIK